MRIVIEPVSSDVTDENVRNCAIALTNFSSSFVVSLETYAIRDRLSRAEEFINLLADALFNETISKRTFLEAELISEARAFLSQKDQPKP